MRGDKAYVSGHGPLNPDAFIRGPFGKVGAELTTITRTARFSQIPDGSKKLLDPGVRHVHNGAVLDVLEKAPYTRAIDLVSGVVSSPTKEVRA